MIRQVKHIIKVILIFALVMCWGITLGYANNIERDNDTINFYFENGNINVKQVLKLVDGYCDKPSMTIEVTDFNEAIESVEFILEYNNSRY